MKLLERWRERRERAWWAKFDREHRWAELADYNGRLSRGIVHTAEYEARMREEQNSFDQAHGVGFNDIPRVLKGYIDRHG